MDLLDTARLLTSEVVTNAIVHAGSSVRLTVQLTGGRLRIAVRDRSDDHPEMSSEEGKGGGKGLLLLDTLAASWGVDTDDNGKEVWFELSP